MQCRVRVRLNVCVCVCVSLCPVSGTPVVYGATFMNTQNTNAVASMDRRTDGSADKMNEHTKTNDSNALFQVCCVHLTQTKFQTEKYFDAWDFSGVPALFV